MASRPLETPGVLGMLILRPFLSFLSAAEDCEGAKTAPLGLGVFGLLSCQTSIGHRTYWNFPGNGYHN